VACERFARRPKINSRASPCSSWYRIVVEIVRAQRMRGCWMPAAAKRSESAAKSHQNHPRSNGGGKEGAFPELFERTVQLLDPASTMELIFGKERPIPALHMCSAPLACHLPGGVKVVQSAEAALRLRERRSGIAGRTLPAPPGFPAWPCRCRCTSAARFQTESSCRAATGRSVRARSDLGRSAPVPGTTVSRDG
jgi:hypothetical protein